MELIEWLSLLSLILLKTVRLLGQVAALIMKNRRIADVKKDIMRSKSEFK